MPRPGGRPTVHADRRPRLLQRNAIAAAIRDWFAAATSSKSRPPRCRSRPATRRICRPLPPRRSCPDGPRQPLYLHTSPEFACKKLLAAGETRIFSFGPVYRNRERGPLHHPEFTMLEWYRVGETYDSLMDDCAALLQLAAERAGTKTFAFRGSEADPFAEPERLTRRRRLFAPCRHRPPGHGRSGRRDRPRRASCRRLAEAGLRTAPDDTWTDLFSRVMVERIEPALGIGRATILYEYPIPEAALARPSPPTRESPSVSSSIAAASNSPTPSAN